MLRIPQGREGNSAQCAVPLPRDMFQAKENYLSDLWGLE